MPAYTNRLGDLRARGPVFGMNIAVTAAAETAYVSAGQLVPPPEQAIGLVDTGATVSMICTGVAQRLGLNPVGVTLVTTASSQNVQMPLYAVRFLLPNNIVFEITAIEADLQAQGLGALIGRDVLSQAVLVYIGYANEFTIAV